MRLAAILFAIVGVCLLSIPAPRVEASHASHETLYKVVWKQVYYPSGHYAGYGYSHAGYYWVKEYVPVAVLKQTYSVSHDAEKAGIIDELRQLRKEIAAQRQGLAGAGAGAADGLAILRRECASCHGANVAEKSGDGFVLLDEGGNLVAMGKGAARRVSGRVDSTDAALRMPPGKQLSAEDRAAVRGLMGGK